MNRDHLPCRDCAKFIATGGQKAHQDGAGYCDGWEKDVLSTDRPCVLFSERGTWQDRRAQQRIHDDQFARKRTVPAAAGTTTKRRETA